MKLKDIMVNEVSLVNKGANRKKFYIVKRDETKEEVKENKVETVETKVEEVKEPVKEVPPKEVETKQEVVEEEFDAEDLALIQQLDSVLDGLEKEVNNL